MLGVAGALSWMGSSMTTFTVILRDKDAVGPIGVSFILLSMMIPTIVFAPVAGLVADKFSTRQLIPPLLVFMGLSNLTLAFNPPQWWTYVALAVTASCGVAVGASFNAALPTIAAKDDVPRAMGIQQTYSSFGNLFAPALAGILVAASGYFWPFIIDAITFFILATTILLLKINRPGVVHEEGEKLKAMDGVREVFGDDLMRSLVILLAVLILALGVINVGEVFLITDELGGDAFIYGLAGSLFAIGSVTGGATASLIKVPIARQPSIVVGAIGALVLTVIGLSQAPHWGVALALSFVAGVGNSMLNAYGIGIIIRRSKSETRGRVMAAVSATVTFSSVSASGMAGLLIGIFGVREVLLVGGVISAVVLIVLGPAVLRAGRRSALQDSQSS
jgi:MFS family permease